MTLDEFLDLPEKEGLKRELSNGKLIEEDIMGMANPRHEIVKANFNWILSGFLHRTGLGRIFPESMFTVQRGARIPDLSIVLTKHLPLDPTGRALKGAPDIAVEVVSPSETAMDLEDKIEQYLDSGAAWVWVAYPDQRSIRTHSPSGNSWILRGDQNLEAPDALPGFSEPVSGFFEGI